MSLVKPRVTIKDGKYYYLFVAGKWNDANRKTLLVSESEIRFALAILDDYKVWNKQ